MLHKTALALSLVIAVTGVGATTPAYHLKVQHNGQFRWNGQVVDEATLRDYLRKFSAMPKGAGPLSVQFEPGTRATIKELVRRDITDSGLRRQKRCVEVKWDAPTAIVN